jgi:hypothetical protein
VLLEDRTSHAYPLGDLARLIVFSPFELLVYRPLIVWARIKGTWRFLHAIGARTGSRATREALRLAEPRERPSASKTARDRPRAAEIRVGREPHPAEGERRDQPTTWLV